MGLLRRRVPQKSAYGNAAGTLPRRCREPRAKALDGVSPIQRAECSQLIMHRLRVDLSGPIMCLERTADDNAVVARKHIRRSRRDDDVVDIGLWLEDRQLTANRIEILIAEEFVCT